MKKYTIKTGETFTQKKADELIEFLEAKDKDCENLLKKINRKLLKAIPLLTPMSIKDNEIKESQKILLKLCDLIESQLLTPKNKQRKCLML